MVRQSNQDTNETQIEQSDDSGSNKALSAKAESTSEHADDVKKTNC